MLTTASGIVHGLINSLPNSVKFDDFKRFAEKDREAMKKLKEKEEKMVKARYVHKNGGNEELSRPYMRWDGVPIKIYRLLHNHVYDLPQGFIDEVNGNPGMPKRSEILDTHGVPTKTDQAAEKLHCLYPAEF